VDSFVHAHYSDDEKYEQHEQHEIHELHEQHEGHDTQKEETLQLL
jgi:hypothetical protein